MLTWTVLLWKKNCLAKKEKIFDKNSKIVVPDYKTVDIDTEKDLKSL